MHILYIHQHFALPSGSTGTRSYEFARRWVKAGHKVTIITGHYDIGGLQKPTSLIEKRKIDGIDVIITGTTYSNKQRFPRRIFSFVTFMFFSIIAGLRVKNIDVIYATSTPLTIGIPAMILKNLKHTPFVFEVRDQWPEVPIQLGIIKNKLLIKALLWLEKTIYTSSSVIVALSPGMAEGIRNIIRNQKQVEVIPNCCDTDVFRPDIDGSHIREIHGWDDKFVLLYFGAIGKANGLEFVVHVAEKLRDNPNIHFVLIGEGGEKRYLIEKTQTLGLQNVEILDCVPKQQLSAVVAACDVSMVIFADFPILQHNSANKFFDSLSAGKPVLLNYRGWQADILEKHKAGLGCELYNVDDFADKIIRLGANRNLLEEMDKNASLLAKGKFDRDKLAAEALAVLDKASNVNRS